MKKPDDIRELLRKTVEAFCFVVMSPTCKRGDIDRKKFTWAFYEVVGKDGYTHHFVIVRKKTRSKTKPGELIGGAWTPDWGEGGVRPRPLPSSQIPIIEGKYKPKE